METIFKKYKIANGESELIGYGDLSIRLKRQGEGWVIKSFEKAKEEPEGGDYYQTGVSDTIILAPALQTKPLVFKGSGLSIMPLQKLTFFIKIPIVVQVYHTKQQPENLVKEIIHTRLSDTWFGEPDSGEAAFSIGSEFRLNMDELDLQTYQAVCPVQVFNNWNSLLELQRLILRVENLSLLEVKDNIFTSLVKIEYKGKDSISSAEYVTSKAVHGEKPKVLAKPRNENSKSLKLNFHFIQNIYKNM